MDLCPAACQHTARTRFPPRTFRCTASLLACKKPCKKSLAMQSASATFRRCIMSAHEAVHQQMNSCKDLFITNKLGIHARPASMFVRLANQFKCEVAVEKDGEIVNGKSIMGLMMLAAGPEIGRAHV